MTDLLVSLRDLSSKLGESQSLQVQFVPDETWATGVLQVSGGTPVAIRVTLTSVDSGVLVQVQGGCTLLGECVRCLEPIEKLVRIDATEMFFAASQFGRAAGEKAGGTGAGTGGVNAHRPSVSQNSSSGFLGSRQKLDNIETEGDEFDEPYLIERDQIDLEPFLRDEILGQSDYRPLCQPNCLGLCSHCGIKLAEAPEDHRHEFTNPSFAALADLFEQNKGKDN